MLQKNILSFVKNYGLIFAVFLAAPYFVLTPLFQYETWPGGHDSWGTLFNAWMMVKTLWEDPHIPVIWQADNAGYNGNPHWAFYQPLSFIIVYLTSLFTSIFNNDLVCSGLKGAVYLSFLISEIGMFILLRTIFKDVENRNLISLYGGLIYLLAPYRFIDLYSRNAYSELWVLSWMPFYFLGFYKLFFLKETKGWLLIAISTPVLFISHLMPSFFFIIIIHLSLLFFLIVKRNLISFILENKKVILWWFIANIIGGIASLIYILPAINVLKYLNGDITGFDRVDLNTVLNHIEWSYAFLDLRNFGERWSAGQLFLISFLILNFLLLSKKKLIYKDLAIFLTVSTIITLIFLLSKTLWEHLPPICYGLQFSWRLFLVYSLLCSIIITLVITEMNIKIPVLIILLIFHFYTCEKFLHSGGEDLLVKHFNVESWVNNLHEKGSIVLNSHSPHSVLTKTSDPVLFNFTNTDKNFSNTVLLNLKPGITILSHEHKGNTFIYELLLDNPAFLIFKQYFHPTWELYIDSKKTKNLYLTDLGHIGFEVPKGKHFVKIRTD